MKVKTPALVKVLKALTSLLKKDDFVYLAFLENELQISTDVLSSVFTLAAEHSPEPTYDFIKLQISEFVSLSKLTKKDQIDFVELIINENQLSQKLPNGLTFTSSFEPIDPCSIELKLIAEDLVYLEAAQVSSISKTLQKQKDLSYLTILDFGFLFVGERQVSYINFADEQVETTEVSSIFTNTQLNNLNGITQEIGFSLSDKLVWGSSSSSQLDLLQTKPDIEFQVRFEKKDESLAKFGWSNWCILKSKFIERKAEVVELTIKNTKQLDKLITSSKSGISDPYDLVVLEANSETQELSFYFYQDRVLKNSFSIASETQIETDVQLNLQTKHLLSLLNLANNELTFYYLNETEPIWSVSDLEIQSMTIMSMVI